MDKEVPIFIKYKFAYILDIGCYWWILDIGCYFNNIFEIFIISVICCVMDICWRNYDSVHSVFEHLVFHPILLWLLYCWIYSIDVQVTEWIGLQSCWWFLASYIFLFVKLFCYLEDKAHLPFRLSMDKIKS